MKEQLRKSVKVNCEFQRVETKKEESNLKPCFEVLLEEIGAEGKYQKILILCFMIPLAIINSIGSSDTNLLLTTPSHSCHVPRNLSINITEEEWKNLTIPWEKNSLGEMARSSCAMFNITGKESLRENPSWNDLFHEKEIQGCKYGWDFDKSSWDETPVTQFGWVCQDKYIVPFMFSLRYAGCAIGTLLFSLISDRFGRKPTFFFVLMLHTTCSVIITFVQTTFVFAIVEFLIALSYYTFYQMAYIIVIELCGGKLRAFTVSSSFIACVMGNCLMALTAHLSSSWKTFILTCHLPSLLFLLYWRILPESPRWLLSRSKVSECEKILIKISRINGREFSERSRNLLMEAQNEEKNKISLKSFMASFVLAKHLVLTSLILSISYILYSGMVLNIHNMTGSKILNYFILSLVEIPGNAVGSIAAQYFGRRLSSAAFASLSAVCSLASIFVLKDPVVLGILCVINKMSAGALVLIIYLQIGELFPTLMRATAYGVTGIISLAALIFIPPLIAMGSSDASLPYCILFGIGLFGVLLCSFLPETIGLPLPQTINEAVLIGQNQSYFSFIHKWNANQYLKDQYCIENLNKITEPSLH